MRKFLELSNCNNHEEAAKFLYNKYSPKLGVISTCGSKGALWVDKDDNSFCTAFNIDSIDTTGAGDSFIGGLIYYYFIEKQSKLESLSFACACAAIKCTQTGGRIDTNLDKVLKFMKTNLK
ncbi:carbohydrate kinase family protein [Clostridium sporogenes]|uniref:carbohydrate kinase family protein n=1 Tax=Clostridium sporogenes TaxID=1509 RepID=UPI003F8F6CF3